MLNKTSGRGITAKKWKDFIITSARVCLWEKVSEDAYKMVFKFAEACEIVLCDPLNQDGIKRLENWITSKSIQKCRFYLMRLANNFLPPYHLLWKLNLRNVCQISIKQHILEEPRNVFSLER